MVKVQLIHTVKLLPGQSVVRKARTTEMVGEGPLLLEPTLSWRRLEAGLRTVAGEVQVVLANPTGFTHQLEVGKVVGVAEPVTIEPLADENTTRVQHVSTREHGLAQRKGCETYLEMAQTSQVQGGRIPQVSHRQP